MQKKSKLIQMILEQLSQDLITLKSAALATYDAATNEESKPENQYDTRALEASYLAGAQAQRLSEVEAMIFQFRSLQIKDFGPNDPIDLTALVEVSLNGKRSYLFMVGKGGGMKMSLDGEQIQTVTPTSPLGEALLGLNVGDVANVEDKTQVREYKILSLC